MPVSNLRSLTLMTAVAAMAWLPAIAQTSGPGIAQPSPPAAVPGLVATINNPNLSVATVKLDHGTRAGKMIGADVYIASNDKVGDVDDLIMTDGNKVTVAVISVGGVLGLGAKLVAVPYSQLSRTGGKLMLSGVTKDQLKTMPSFEY